MGKATRDGSAFFSKVTPATINPAGAQSVTWNFQCELKRAEGE
jgi:hypothetical protein